MSNQYRVEVYHFSDDSVYVAPRKDNRTIETIIADAKYRTDVSSPVYEKSRKGQLTHKTILFEGLSKKKAREFQITTIRVYESLGVRVINVRR